MKKKVVRLCMAVALTASMLSACAAPSVNNAAPAESEPAVEEKKEEVEAPAEVAESEEVPVIKFAFIGGETEQQAQEFALEGAEEKFGCKIEWVTYQSLPTMYQQIPTQIAVGTAPDIICGTNEQYIQFVKNGMFLDMAPYLTDEDFDFSTVSAQHQCWVIDGGIYGIPQDGGPACFIINMDMWNAAGLGDLPKTWDDVAAAAEALTTDEVKGLCVNIDEDFHPTQYVLSYGGGWNFGETINTKENQAGIQYILDLYRKGYVITPAEAGLGWDGEVFTAGKCAMSTGGMWYVANNADAAPDMNYAIIPMPEGTTHGCTGHSDATNVLSSTKYPEICSKIAAYMAREEAQEKISELYGNPPANIELQKEFFEKNPELKDVQAAMEFAQPFGYPEQSVKFADALALNLQKAVYEDPSMTAEDVLANVEEAMEKE